MPRLKSTTGVDAVANSDNIYAEIAAYEFTTETIVFLERVFNDLADTNFRQGPRMEAAGGKGDAPVTPDMVFEAAGTRRGLRSPGYRAVGEIKASFPRFPTALDQLVEQIQKYDDDLDGWETGRAAASGPRIGHDLVIAARLEQARTFAASLPAAFQDRGVEIKKPLSILGVVRRKGEDVDLFRVEKLSGRISHAGADSALAKSVEIQAYELLKELDGTKFYDSRPPLQYIMAILWVQVFPKLAHDKKRKRLHMREKITIDVGVDRVHRLVSRFAPPSNPRCIERSWIAASLNEFVKVGLAREKEGKYTIYYVPNKTRPLSWLVRLTTKGRRPGPMAPGEGGEKEGGGSLEAFMGEQTNK